MKGFFSFVRRRKKKTKPLSSVADTASPFGSVGFGQYFPYDGHDQQTSTPSPFNSSRYRYALNEYLQTVEPLDGVTEESGCSSVLNNNDTHHPLSKKQQIEYHSKEDFVQSPEKDLDVPNRFPSHRHHRKLPDDTSITVDHFGPRSGNIIEVASSLSGCDPEAAVDDVKITYSKSIVIGVQSPPPPPPLRPNRLLASVVVPPIQFATPTLHSPDAADTQETISDCYFYDGGDGMYQGKLQRQPKNEPNMPDTTYEETYGDSYVGGPIRYIYPSGYHSLRPRSGPWKLSLLVFVTFSWLSVFIVGYCADMVDLSISYDTSIDDYSRKLETQWCGSTSVRMMWILSISITGIAAAYCSIIGYVQGRDFVVANCRSQPPGMSGKSDYYIKIEDMKKVSSHTKNEPNASHQSYQTGRTQSIYQADGTPQFWGDYIYRPTQAAVAVTSR
jgi:hypothetical protein